MEPIVHQSGSGFRRLIGLELAGPHAERSAVVALDEYPQSARLVVSQVHANLGATQGKTSDENLRDLLRELSSPNDATEFLGLVTQAPLSMPPFFKDEDPRSRETRWMSDLWNRTKPRPRPFLPYLNRPLDLWMRYFTPERFQVPEAMGANFAPLAARLQALRAELPTPLFESFPRATLARIVSGSSLNRFWPKLYTDAEKGLEVREEFLDRLLTLCPQIFVYEGDLETLIVDLASFQAFLSALSLFLFDRGACDPRPEGFPESASWLLLPRQKIRWDALFVPR
jgi:hypothetical protein